MLFSVEKPGLGKSAVCEPILRSLPEWFAIERAIVQYLKDIDTMPTVLARADGEITGFLTIKRHNEYSAEVHVMGVRPGSHRKGIGRKLLREAEEFLRRSAAKHKRGRLELTEAARSLLASSPWPGNVRQLENAIERAVILAEGSEILPEHLGDAPSADAPPPGAEPLPLGATLLEVGKQAQRRAEEEAIRRALVETGGNKTEAARLLGVSYKTLWAKLKEYERE